MYAPVDENFPSRRQLLMALGVAMLTGLLGFGLSYSWFLAIRPLKLPTPVDRKAAEGGVPRFAQRSGGGTRWEAPPTFLIVSGTGYRRPEKKLQLVPKEVEELKARITPPTTAPAAAKPKVARVELPSSAYPTGSSSHGYRPTGRPTPLSETTPAFTSSTGRTFPPAGSRPPAGSLQDGWTRAQGSVVQLQGFGDAVCYGLVVDSDGLVITRSSPMLVSGMRAMVNGLSVPVLDVVGYVPEYELAVLRLPGGQRPAALAPEAPSPGEELALAPGAGLALNLQTAIMLEPTPSVGEGTFRLQGAVYPTNTGSPLVNSRGEVIGLCLGKPTAYPGQNYTIGVDNAVLWSVLQQAKTNQLDRSPGSPDTLSHAVRAQMLSQLPRSEAWSPPSRANARAVPGESMGMYNVGMTRDDLERAFGVGKVPSFPGGFRKVQVDPYPLEFTLLDDRVVAIATTDRFYATSRGVGVGMEPARATSDPAFESAVYGYGPAGRRHLVGKGIELRLNPSGTAEEMLVVSEPLR